MQWDLTGALPLTTSPVHGALGTLVEAWTTAAESGSLNPVTWALLDRHAPGWCSVGARRNLVRQRANHWSGFRAVHGRDPKESSTETSERSLAGWVRRLRTKARRGTLTSFEDTLLSMLIPEWRESA